MKEMTRTP